MKHKIFAVSALALALTACDDNDVTAGTNNVEGTVEIGGISASGIPFIGDELSASVADANGLESSTVIAYQWMADGTAISGATSVEYIIAEADEGAAITVSAVYTDNDNFAEDITSAATELVTIEPVDVDGVVTISGIEEVGEELTATLVDDNGISTTVEYQWFRSGTAIDGATSGTYELVADDETQTITVQVSYTDDIGTEVVALESVATGAIAAEAVPVGELSNVALIIDEDDGDTGELRLRFSDTDTDAFPDFLPTGKITFTLIKEELLDINDDGGVDLPAAAFFALLGTSTSNNRQLIDVRIDNNGVFSLRNSDLEIDDVFGDDVAIDVEMTWDATNASTTQAPEVSLMLNGDLVTPANFTAPGSSDATILADQLSALSGGVGFAQFRMGDSGSILSGEYRIDDIVIYSDVAGTVLAFEENFDLLADGTSLVGANGFNGSGSEAVVEADFEFPTADEEVASQVEAQTEEDAAAAAAAAAAALPPVDVAGTVAISGTETVGNVLTAAVSDDNGTANATITYQWQRGGADITGETASTYTLVDADEGETITIAVSYTDDDGFDTTATASTAGTIAAAPAPVVVSDAETITGFAASVTDSLTTDTGEIRIDLGAIENAIQNGSASFVLNKGTITRASGSGGNVGFAIFGDNASGSDAIIDVTFNNDESIETNNLSTDIDLADAYSLDTDTFVEVTWNTDGTAAPAVTLSINGTQIASGTSTGTNDGTNTDPDAADFTGDNVSTGLIVFQIQVNDNTNTTTDSILVDNILIRNEATDSEVRNFTFDDGTFTVDEVLRDNDGFASNTQDATVVDTGL